MSGMIQYDFRSAKPMTAELTELNAVVAEFPPEALRRVIDYARRLTISADVPYWERPGFSSEWTEEDMRDATNACLRSFEEQHPDEEWVLNGDPT